MECHSQGWVTNREEFQERRDKNQLACLPGVSKTRRAVRQISGWLPWRQAERAEENLRCLPQASASERLRPVKGRRDGPKRLRRPSVSRSMFFCADGNEEELRSLSSSHEIRLGDPPLIWALPVADEGGQVSQAFSGRASSEAALPPPSAGVVARASPSEAAYDACNYAAAGGPIDHGPPPLATIRPLLGLGGTPPSSRGPCPSKAPLSRTSAVSSWLQC